MPRAAVIDPKNTPPNKSPTSASISRCSPTLLHHVLRRLRPLSTPLREIAGTAELQIINRGHHSEIDIFPGDPVNNKLAGNVVDLCPVGALANKDFLYKQRVWFLKAQKSVCAGCSTGCSINIDHNKDIVYRIRPRENPQAQGYFICDEGRFDYAYVNEKDRFQQPLAQLNGSPKAPAAWETTVATLRSELTALAKEQGGAIAGVISPMLTVEEAFLLAKFIKGLSADAKLYLGWVPTVGADENFPQDRKGNPLGAVKFTIRAEKCPNRRGVEAILKHFQGEVLGFDRLIADASNLKALYLTAAYSPRLGAWLNDEQTATLAKVPLLVVQDLSPRRRSSAAARLRAAGGDVRREGRLLRQPRQPGAAASLGRAPRLHWPLRRADFPQSARSPRLDPGEGDSARIGARGPVLRALGGGRPRRIRREIKLTFKPQDKRSVPGACPRVNGVQAPRNAKAYPGAC